MSMKRIYGYTQEQLLVIEPELLAGLLPGKGHSSVEYPLYQAISRGNTLPASFGQSFRDLNLKTYIALGWPAQVRLPPGRKSVKDALLPRKDVKTTEIREETWKGKDNGSSN